MDCAGQGVGLHHWEQMKQISTMQSLLMPVARPYNQENLLKWQNLCPEKESSPEWTWKREETSLLGRWGAVDDIVSLFRFSLSYVTNTNFMSSVDLSPLFAFFKVNTKSRAPSRPSHEPFIIQSMAPSLSPHSVCPCWNYHSLQPGTNPWGLSFTQHSFFARTGHGVQFSLGQISHWGPLRSRESCLEVTRQTTQCLSWGLEPLGRKLPSFCSSFPSVKDIFGIGWFSNEVH